MKGTVLQFFKEFHDNGRITKGLNSSFVALIPKSENPVGLAAYRPISLVGCIYKVLAKVLVNRLRPVLPQVIGEVQSAFLGGRNIQDEILIASEVIDFWKKRKLKGAIIKLDFEKAYDNLNWKYLLQMMEFFGFPNKWIAWIKECISTATLSVLVNGSPTKEFAMEKGIRQGDPLSPFLFIIAAAGLNLLFQKAKDAGLIKGVQFNQNFSLTHLQFVDDTIVVSNGEVAEVENIKRILRCFEVMSGLRINYHKSTVSGVGMTEEESMHLASILKCKTQSLPIKYLGLPLGVSPRLKSSWKPVIDKFKQKLSSWKNKFLSFGGRVTLIKSVLNSLPIYYLSLFRIPEGVVKEINSIQSKFLWGDSSLKKKIHLVNWEKVSMSRERGGLGIKKIKAMNEALLIKWWWRFGTKKDALWKTVICSKSRDNLNGWFPDARLANRNSVIWRDIMSLIHRDENLLDGYDSNVRLVVGDGKNISSWRDRWTGNFSLVEQFPRLFNMAINREETAWEVKSRSVSNGAWNIQFRRRFFTREEELWNSLLTFLPPVEVAWSDTPDQLRWEAHQLGTYKVHSMYSIMEDSCGQKLPCMSIIWKNVAPPKVQCFSWLAYLGKVKSADKLLRMGVIDNEEEAKCCFCKDKIETNDHVLLLCSSVWGIWTASLQWSTLR